MREMSGVSWCGWSGVYVRPRGPLPILIPHYWSFFRDTADAIAGYYIGTYAYLDLRDAGTILLLFNNSLVHLNIKLSILITREDVYIL